ncbi:cyclin-like protein, partial [Ascobolus immersus RN42]
TMPAHQNSWLFTPAELRHTPSILSGMPPREERERRAKGIHFILQVGIALKVPQLTISTAAVFLHRFYMRQKMQVHHHYEIAATSLFLATKVEENMKKYDHLITEVIRVAQKNPKMPPVDRHSGDFWRWSDVIQEKEELMLEALCFDLHVPKSYDFLLAFTKTLDVETKEVLRSAWSFLNDSYMSLVCLVYRAEAIAAGAL